MTEYRGTVTLCRWFNLLVPQLNLCCREWSSRLIWNDHLSTWNGLT